MTAVSYETAVFVEDVEALTNDVLAAIRQGTEHLPEGHVRDAIIGAALITAAQALDGVAMPKQWKLGGITSMIRHITDKWTYPCRAS